MAKVGNADGNNGKPHGWIKEPEVRVSADHTYDAGKSIPPSPVKSAKQFCSAKSKGLGK